VVKKKVATEETVEVRMYDEEIGDFYMRSVPKVPVSNCVLCGCAGCLSDKCCEHLEYWGSEHGQPARYQVRTLAERIERLEGLITKLERNRTDAVAAINAVVSQYDKASYQPQEVSVLRTLKAALSEDILTIGRTFCHKNEHLCSACSCQKCSARIFQAMKNKHNWDSFTPVPECCGHKDYTPGELPF
jgi:hypothetical protein